MRDKRTLYVNKIRARLEKEKDKIKARGSNKIVTATFDMEAVLQTPCSKVSQMYYKRKLNCFNLSVYSLGDGKAVNYLWNEIEGQRGSCEVASCLHKYISSLPPSVDHVILYSDTCTGQNRNQYVSAALMNAVCQVPNIKIIDQKCLERGQTHMECDSMHAAIEFVKKNTEAYVPSEWQ